MAAAAKTSVEKIDCQDEKSIDLVLGSIGFSFACGARVSYFHTFVWYEVVHKFIWGRPLCITKELDTRYS